MATSATLTRWAPIVLSVVRIIVGLLFFEHGTQKLFGFPPGGRPGPEFLTLMWYQAIIELVGGALLAVGLFTRTVAFILCGDMAVAYFMGHAPKGFYPVLNGGDLAILYCFIFLYFVFGGPGPWSADGVRRRA